MKPRSARTSSSSEEKRPPINTPRASTMMDLPEPVFARQQIEAAIKFHSQLID